MVSSWKGFFYCNETHVCLSPDSHQIIPYPHNRPTAWGLFPLLHVSVAVGTRPAGTLGIKRGQHPLSWTDLQPHAWGCCLCHAVSLLLARAWASANLPLLLHFSVGGAGRLANGKVWSHQVQCAPETRDLQSEEIKRQKWEEKPNGWKPRQGTKTHAQRIEIDCKKFERPQKTVWGFDISPYVRNSHRWSHGSHRMKWRDESKQFMKLLQLAVGL